MKEKNWYTSVLFLIGLLSILYMSVYINIHKWPEVLIIISFIFILDFFPIKLPSEDEYNVGFLGFLYLLFMEDFEVCILAFLLSTLAMNLRVRRFSLRKINWFRFFVTIGMWYICGIVTVFVIQVTEPYPLLLRIILSICTFELVNQLILSGIFRTVMNIPIFHNYKAKLRELIIPIIIGMVILPKFLVSSNVQELAVEVLYATILLAVIIFFSKNYIEQIFLRQDMSRKIVQLLENRIASRITGHGTRVGAICEALLETLEYPKQKRPELVQIAIIHDIGKSLLPSYVFEKRGALTLSEEKEYESHCEKGAEIIRTIYPKGSFADWVLYHHERWDGKGFPRGLKGKEIPLESRILALCNQIDHIMMRHQDDETVYRVLGELAGTSLDPELVNRINVKLITSIREVVGYSSAVKKYYEEESIGEISQNLEEKQHIGNSVLLRYTSHLINETALVLPEKKFSDLAEICKKTKRSFHEHIEFQGKTYEAHFFPYGKEVLIFVHDLTPMLRFKKKTLLQILESYQDVIRTLSKEKIYLCVHEQELLGKLGDYIGSISIHNVDDVPRSREFVSKYVLNYNVSKSIKEVLLAVSEATTNLIKHATDGEISLFSKEGAFQVLIADKGSGIPLHELPKTILVSGYSSKRSLGRGFSLMEAFSDKVMVYTSSDGTKILLEFAVKVGESEDSKEKKEPLLNILPM